MVGFKAALPVWRSVSTRVALCTLAIILVSLWGLTWYAIHSIRGSLLNQTIEHQTAVAAVLGTEINEHVEDRKFGLRSVAKELARLDMRDSAALQAELKRHPILNDMFNGGLFVADPRGVAIASIPEALNRIGTGYQERDYIQMALRSTETVVGVPVVGKRLNTPVFGMAYAIRGLDGTVLGVLVGITNLGESSFIDKVANNRFGNSGGYFIVHRASRMVVTATDKARVMTPAAEPGFSALIDGFMDGKEGSGVTINSSGVRVLASARQIPAANWFVAVSIPATEAFAPIDDVLLRLLLVSLVLSTMAGAVTWVFLKHQMAPLLAAARSLADQPAASIEAHALPVQSDDEVGDLIRGFNSMLSNLKDSDAELRIAAAAFESQEGIFVTDANWVILKVNKAFTRMTGYSADEALGALPQTLLGSNRQDESFYKAMGDSLDTQGSWQGEVWDRRKDGTVFPIWLILTALRDSHGIVTHYVVTMTDITERKAAEEEIRNLAFFDPLTGLPNRRLLMDRLGRAVTLAARHKRKGALLFLDLDNFKDLNDTLGHDKGDQLLKQVAQRLQTCIREGDTVARLGGDEFVVMLQDLSESADLAVSDAEHVAHKILEVLNLPYNLTEISYRSTPSIGITLFGEKPEPLDELLKQADLAMYQAKAAGRNTLRFFDAQMQTAVSHRASLEAALREALELNQFMLYYQAQVNEAGEVTGAEALVRWLHPLRGMVSPMEFIPMAEDTGIILPLGNWILDTACRQLAAWARVPQLKHLTLSVNISARQLTRADFVEGLLATLAATGADPHLLKLELTESVLVSDVDNTVAKMRALKARGIGFSMDDFGTGYSSLAFLKLLPLSQLKIDQGFVRDILVDTNDAAIAKMVIALADSLGLDVIAEGVETEAQREFLASQGCHAYQGYLFGRPVDGQTFEASVLAAITA